MTEKDDPQSNIKRMRSSDRKQRLPRARNPIPPEDDAPLPELDLDRLALPDSDRESLETLARLGDEVRAPIITPLEERFPPVNPHDHRPHVPRPASTADDMPQRDPRQRQRRRYNILSLVALLATVALVLWLALIWRDPQSALNPLPPATPYVVVTATPPDFNADEPVIVIVATETPTRAGDNTTAGFAFAIANVRYEANTNALGCDWWSIGGQVLSAEGEPLSGYRVHVRGADVDETVFSGSAAGFGAGGYEFALTGTPQEATFAVELLAEDGRPLSDEILITTNPACDQNVVIIDFVQNR